MTNLTFYLFIRGFLSAVLLLGGVYALKKGFELYMNGVGLREEDVSITGGKSLESIKISLKRVGSVVMMTSIGWAYIGYLVMPQGVTESSGDESKSTVGRQEFSTNRAFNEAGERAFRQKESQKPKVPEIGIGGSHHRLRPCHTTRRAGPHRAVREFEVTTVLVSRVGRSRQWSVLS